MHADAETGSAPGEQIVNGLPIKYFFLHTNTTTVIQVLEFGCEPIVNIFIDLDKFQGNVE